MADVGIFVGTVYGNALLVAEEAQVILSRQGHKAKVYEDPRAQDWALYRSGYALIVTSTTGQGALPDSIVPLFEAIKTLGCHCELRYGLIALGDSTYENYCGGGKRFDALLREQGATRLGEVLTIDASEAPEPESVSNLWVEAWGRQLPAL
ncbi:MULTISPECIES: flavodoxin [Tenebrionibacter/Tenebrionicola group]|jgi:flavodoxin|uniref:Flavodoxin n=2 Tax=Tenebrionibacter/Tenebrionicola group TaxID=2969848 RepID=A0A8K0V1E7_9ENTR|nr:MULTISPECIES: flavodoxin [Tenebrionibacter/Tenebrionicola group]MBK4714941.1 flavodoxin [Tenebrionibacter intestinalis]MBV5095767.1 flavodoxin [Tenebrionicola larvae]